MYRAYLLTQNIHVWSEIGQRIYRHYQNTKVFPMTTQNLFLYNHNTFFIPNYRLCKKWKELNKDMFTNLMGKLIHKMIVFTWKNKMG